MADSFTSEVVAVIVRTGNWGVIQSVRPFRQPAIALALIEAGRASSFVANIDKWELLTPEVACRLVQAGYAEIVMSWPARFGTLDESVALALMSVGEIEYVERFPEIFSGLGLATVKEFIKCGRAGSAAWNAQHFRGVDYDEMALMLIDNLASHGFIANLHKVPKLGRRVAEAMIREGQGFHVASNANRFLGMDQTMVDTLLERGFARQLAWHGLGPTDKDGKH